MKTSYILLATIALLTVTGMVATDVLLKQQYERIDWRNPYQDFTKKSLPVAKHWVIDGSPDYEILLVKTNEHPQALLHPEAGTFYRTRQLGDTVYVTFKPEDDGFHNDPIADADHEMSVRVVLQLPQMQTVSVKNARLTVAELTTSQLKIQLENSRLRTRKVAVAGVLELQEKQNSFAVFGTDQLTSLQLMVQDSSGIELDDTQITNLAVKTSPKAKVHVQGQALKWIRGND